MQYILQDLYSSINLVYEPNENCDMMKLSIQRWFDCDKMDQLMNQCRNEIDIWQRESDCYNALHIEITAQRVSMVEHSLDKVSQNDEMQRKIFDQTIGLDDTHISCVSREREQHKID